jgi:invasion protein IalB
MTGSRGKLRRRRRVDTSHYLRVFARIVALATCCDTGSMAMAKQEPDADPRPAATNRNFIPSNPRYIPRVTPESAAVTPSGPLPNGASSISEIYGNWAVGCQIIDGQKRCLLLQTEIDGNTGKPTFAIELRVPHDGRTDGTILMPFGLRLGAGAVLMLDDRSIEEGLQFSTCVPQGCLLPVSLPASTVDTMKTARMLTVASLNLSSGALVTFKIQLEGFAAAITRISELGR